jgi:hypothetical protein
MVAPSTVRQLIVEGTPNKHLALRPGVTWIQAIPPNGALAETWNIGSDAISNPADRALLMAARRVCDVVVTTARTAAAESYRPSKYAPIAVVDRHSEFLPPVQFGETKPMFGISDLADLAMLEVQSNFILLESGITYAKALGSRLEHFIVTVTNTSDATTALERVEELVRLLNGAQLEQYFALAQDGNVVVTGSLHIR